VLTSVYEIAIVMAVHGLLEHAVAIDPHSVMHAVQHGAHLVPHVAIAAKPWSNLFWHIVQEPSPTLLPLPRLLLHQMAATQPPLRRRSPVRRQMPLS
jgi:hypothetical protein